MKVSDKAKANLKLVELGLPVPPSFVMTKQEHAVLRSYLDKYKDVEYWYLRTVREVEKILKSNVATSASLDSILLDAFRSNPDAQIVVQERVDVAYSGVVARIDGALFIEYVRGGLKSLLRDGVTPTRLLLEPSGAVLFAQENQQEFCYRWQADQLMTEPGTKPEPLADSTKKVLAQVYQRLEEPVVYEWVQDQKENVFFLDIKPVPPGFLKDKASALRLISQGAVITLDLPIRGKLIKSSQDMRRGVFLIEKPLYGYLGEVLGRASGVISLRGGILSHLLVYAAKDYIPGAISPVLFQKFSEKEEIDISSVNALFD